MKPLRKWMADAKSFDYRGLPIAYWTSRETDDRPLLLLIHGFPTSSWDWSAVWPLLRDRFRLAALDMLGFGLSAKPKGWRYSIFQQADLQEALLERLGESEAHILAHDYGVTVAQELLARQEEKALSFRILSVCFLNGGLFPEQHRPLPVQRLGLSPLGPIIGALMSADRLRRNLDEISGPSTRPSEEEIAGHFALMTRDGGRRVLHRLIQYIPERRRHRERWVGALLATPTPLRLICGGRDPVSGRHLYDYYREMTPQADAVLLDAIGHYPQTEAPAETARAYLAFADRVARPVA